jgi:hypothetical protein
MPQVSALLNSLPTVNGVSEADCVTTCRACGRSQNLSQATESSEGDVTLYTCVEGCGPILSVSPLPDTYGEKEGHGVSEWLIANPEHLFVRTMGRERLRFAAKPEAQLAG